MVTNVAVLVGSLRKDSFTKALAVGLEKLKPAGMNFSMVEIGDLPLYNQDLETDTPPEAWVRFRQAVAACDAVLFMTPEYSRSVPGALKNAMDVGARPYGKSVWAGKPGAVISTSPGLIGGFGANNHLRQSLVSMNVPAMQQPEAYISNVATIVKDGEIIKEDTAAFLADYLVKFEAWIARFTAA